MARLVADPELRVTQSGNTLCQVRLAFNSRRQNPQTQQWEDGDTFWVRGTAWRELAENIAETLQRGMEVIVTGELRTESWEKDGVKHQQPALNIRSIGPSLAYATARVAKADRSGGNGGQQQTQQNRQPAQQQTRQQQAPQPQDDPWSVPASNEEPPF
ncbi:single-stranded DNA-binding protein [Streptacidiphilus sp. EB103A]|uniref:single-stranded DNA-binding protein n=1 Tax=Streptacidiphilus sp. EB103A TaxID=3156275 RepID=UPI0035185328